MFDGNHCPSLMVHCFWLEETRRKYLAMPKKKRRDQKRDLRNFTTMPLRYLGLLILEIAIVDRPLHRYSGTNNIEDYMLVIFIVYTRIIVHVLSRRYVYVGAILVIRRCSKYKHKATASYGFYYY